MPLIPPIILSKPNILVTVAGAPNGTVPTTAGYQYGLVEAVYDTCDDLEVGQYILFKPQIESSLLYGSTIFYIVNEAHKLFKEIPL